MDRDFETNIVDFKPIHERFCALRIKATFSIIFLICIHAGTEEGSEVKERFYSCLGRLCNPLPTNDFKILLGDFNAKVDHVFMTKN